MSVFAQFENQTLIRATLEMQTALSVGSRLSLEPTGTDLPVMKGPDGVPFIPGSSIKGAVRSLAERILRTWNQQPEFWACDPFDAPCVPANRKDELMHEAETQAPDRVEQAFSEKVWKASCTACRLFGSPWFAGRVAFKDAFLQNSDDLPVVTQIRDGVGIDRDLGAARTGVKYDFEVVVPGARFGLEILAENVDDRELGFLLTVLRLWEEGSLALGGKVTRGPGWGKLSEIRLYRVDRGNLLDYLLQGQRTERDVSEFIHAFQEYTEKVLKENGREHDA
ncbi:MAG TPA: CRISPR-associated RAMP protein [Caldilineae bacterium]|nr:CRISPR-associated RAMP protein [Caldilineae bacterium]